MPTVPKEDPMADQTEPTVEELVAAMPPADDTPADVAEIEEVDHDGDSE